MIPFELIIMAVLFIGLALLEKKEKRAFLLQYYLLVYVLTSLIALLVGEFTILGGVGAVFLALIIWLGWKRLRYDI